MTPETRRNLFRYGIAIDLVILAAGVGWFFADSPAPLLLAFAVAVLLSVWKGGWQGGLTALVLSFVVMAAMFDVVTPRAMGIFAVGTVAASALLLFVEANVGRASARPEEERTEERPEARSTLLREEASRAREEAERLAHEREETERERARLAAEREAAEQARLEAEARAREEEERLAREREEAERERARLAAEREAAEQARLEAEARAREEAERLAREREEAERERARLAAEREAAEQARLEAEARAREEAERLRLEAEARAREEAERIRLEAEARAREEAERVRLEAEARAREEAERVRLEAEARAREEAERVRLEAEARAREEAERVRLEAEARAREEAERLAREREEAERERARLAAEREAAERARQEAEAHAREEAERLQREREELAAARQAAERAQQEAEARAREEAERARAEADQRAAREREEMQAQLAAEREAMRAALEQQLASEREAMSRDADARVEEARKVVPAPPPAPTPTPAPAPRQEQLAKAQPPKPSLLDTVTGWFKRNEPRTRPNLNNKRVVGNTTATKRAQAAQPPVRRAPAAAAQPQKSRRPRLLLLERRRGTADTILPKLKHRGVEVTVVERWVDAVDELLRVKPDAFFLDIEHPDFEKAYRLTTEKSSNLPIVLTGRGPSAAPANVQFAAFAARPYDLDEVIRLAQQAMSRPDELLAMQAVTRTHSAPPQRERVHTPTPPPSQPVAAAPATNVVRRSPEPIPMPRAAASNDEYAVPCFSCRIDFNAVEADWCSCLAKERSLVCTNCLSCFCKAPPAYKEKFWVEAPPRLFERKSAEARRQQGALPTNPTATEVVRPLVLTVEDDEDIQAIVQRVCANLGYGFVHAMNGQDGLEMAREYRPNLILSDAFMPKLDGREMCRMLKEDPAFTETRMVVMTGLYTDTKYRSEALKRFHVDDYVAKPVAITDLINILQKHLEGVSGLPVQDDLHEMHRREVEEADDEMSENDVALADVLAPPDAPPMTIAAKPAAPPPKPDAYDVCCFNCEQTFDATHAEWCRCVGRDNTVVCAHCGGCFCKAPAPYKERFWIDAPPSLFERKMIGSKRAISTRANPPANDVKRPLILLVEDDENVQLIVRTVVTTMGYGFVVGANGQEGLSLAREYGPDLILSDAFMPKLDGREMCRLLKEDPSTARSKAIIMTGLYTDRKYRNEALDYFKVDDYVAKPLAVDDLIKLFKKHLPQEVATAH